MPKYCLRSSAADRRASGRSLRPAKAVSVWYCGLHRRVAAVRRGAERGDVDRRASCAGAGAALLLPASLAIIRVAWTDERSRNRALGVWAACNGLAFVVGPTAGGALVDLFGWRSVFLIAVPLGLVAFGCAMRIVVDFPTLPAGG